MIKDKIILITGGSTGIGKGIARQFLSKGYITIITARNKDKLEKTKEEFKEQGYNLYTHICDVNNEEDVKSLVSDIIETYGKIDILVNNAGLGFKVPADEMTVEQFDIMINTNIRGVFLMTKYILPHMKNVKDGYIVNISSGAGKNGIAGLSGYCASKFALMGFTESVALEAKPFDIRVSVLCPGSVNSEFHDNLGSNPNESAREAMIQPEDIGETVFHMVTQPKRYWIFEVVTRAFMMGRK